MNHNDPTVAETILESVTEGVFTVDTEWRVTYFNRAAERIIGITRDKALGRHGIAAIDRAATGLVGCPVPLCCVAQPGGRGGRRAHSGSRR